MGRTLLAIGLATLATAAICLSPAQSQTKSKAASEAQEKYQQQLAEIVTEHIKRIIEARTAYIAALQAVVLQAMQNGDLEEAQKTSLIIKETKAQLQQDRSRLSFLLPRAVFDVQGTGFELKVLRDGATAFSNRDFTWQKVPEALDGWRFTQIAGGDTPRIELVIKKGGIVFTATNSPEKLEEEGWLSIEGLLLQYSDPRGSMTLLAKEFKAGDKLQIVHRGWTGTMVLIPSDDQRYIKSFLKRYLALLAIPIDAVQFDKHWYKLHTDRVPWLVAKDRCEQMGGYLACITSRREHEFVTGLVKGRAAWIGGTDAQSEGTWRWLTGEPFEFQAWLPNEPNDTYGREDALAYGNLEGGLVTGWNDWLPDGRIAFVCEWPDPSYDDNTSL